MLSATKSALPEVEKLLPSGISPRWYTQPADPSCFQLKAISHLSGTQAAELASRLSRLVRVFEITQFDEESSSYLFHEGLGIHRSAIDGAGEVVLRAATVERLIELSKGSMPELSRLIRVAKGQPWLDVIEPYRQGMQRLETLPRAV